MRMVMRMLEKQVQKAIEDALSRGNSVEIKRNREGIVVYEVKKTIKYSIPVAKGPQEGLKGAGSN